MFEQPQQDDLHQDLVNSTDPNSLNGISSSLLETDSAHPLELNSNENEYIEESLANLTIKEPDLSTDTNNLNENQDVLTGEYKTSVSVNSVNSVTFERKALTDYKSLKGDLTNLIVGDYNGDGKDDFIRQEKGGWDNDHIRTADIYLSSGDGTFTRQALTDYKSLKGDLTNLIVGDYNGDGNDDFIRQEKGGWDNDNIRTADIYLANTSSGGGHSYNSNSGYGLVNAAAAVAKALGQSSPFPNVGDFNDSNWGVDTVKAPEVWNQGYTGKDIVVAVLDTGVDRNHSDLNDNIWKNTKEIAGNGIDDDGNGYIDDVYGWNFTNNTNNTSDVHGHGTHVSGTIAGERNNFGVTGIAYDAEIMVVKVLNDQGRGSYSGIAQGVRYAVDNGADVINMSLGGGSGSSALKNAIKYASEKGVIVVSAAGNSKGSLPEYPGRYATDWGLVVGAVNKNNNMASFSNRAGDDSKMAYVTAPGVSIYSTLPNNKYASWNGTSMATPHVAGIVALMLDANENLTDAQVRSIITSTAENGGGFSSGSLGTSSVGSEVAVLSSSSIDSQDTNSGSLGTSSVGSEVAVLSSSSIDSQDTSSSSTDTGSEDGLNLSVTNPQTAKEAPFAEGLTVFLPDSETSNEGSSDVGPDFDHESNVDTSDVNTDNLTTPFNDQGTDSTPNNASPDDSSNDGYGSYARYYDDSGLDYDAITGMPIGALGG
ncbi:MAG: S8 family serine peptidase [Crocosphaera sp.]